MLVVVQLFVLGLYLPPVFEMVGLTIDSTPDDHLTSSPDCCVKRARAGGALIVLVGVQLFVAGLYLPPVSNHSPPSIVPPQTIISLPVQTAV